MAKLTFKDIQNYFGDRGYIVKKGDFTSWGNTDEYIYWVPDNTKAEPYLCTEILSKEPTALWVSRKCMYAEIEGEEWISQLPFKFEPTIEQ